MDSKPQIRTHHLAQRRALTPEDRATKSQAIHQRLLSLPEIQNAPQILTYISLKEEVDTRNLINELLAQGKLVLAPATHGYALIWRVIQDLDSLTTGDHNTLEPNPALSPPTTPDPNAPAIIPCAAFTQTGDRLGFGKGYFDRFLANYPGPKIALAFDIQQTDQIPTEPHDIPMNIIVTESTIHRPNTKNFPTGHPSESRDLKKSKSNSAHRPEN